MRFIQQPESGFGPESLIEIDMGAKVVKVFVLDHWQHIGEIKTTTVIEKGHMIMQMQMPDVEGWIMRQVDDGTLDWVNWGPMVN